MLASWICSVLTCDRPTCQRTGASSGAVAETACADSAYFMRAKHHRLTPSRATTGRPSLDHPSETVEIKHTHDTPTTLILFATAHVIRIYGKRGLHSRHRTRLLRKTAKAVEHTPRGLELDESGLARGQLLIVALIQGVARNRGHSHGAQQHNTHHARHLPSDRVPARC